MASDLENEVQQLERQFWVDQDRLKEITKRFIEELDDGLEQEGANIPMHLSWVFGLPTGQEHGSFLALDLDGSCVRVCRIELADRKAGVEQEEYKLPDDLKTGNAYELWFFIAESLERFMRAKKIKLSKDDDPLPLGFTFSWPVKQDYIDQGILTTWTKGFDIDGVEGHDVAEQLQDAISKRKLNIRLVALINDTVGALVASTYNDPETFIGAVFGTGCNLAYLEDCTSIPKLDDFENMQELPLGSKVVINCELGAFDNSHIVLPHTKYDKAVDDESPRPGAQSYEKHCAGDYLGEIFRLVVVDLYERKFILQGKAAVANLQTPYSFTTDDLAVLENDETEDLGKARALLEERWKLAASRQDLQALRRLAIAVAVRGARLCAVSCAAISIKKNITNGHVAADAPVAVKHPKFRKRWATALGEILGWPEIMNEEEQPIKMTLAKDGSGIGAAVVAAMTTERIRTGQLVGIRTGPWERKNSR